MDFKKIGLIGLGTMGSGIATVSLAAGFSVKVLEINETVLEKGMSVIKKNISRMIKKELLTQTEEEYMSKIEHTFTIDGMADCCFVVEAATENKEVKLDIFRKLDEILPSEVILATNTSSISITEIAANTKRPDKVIGMHFMNPVPIMKLVEVIRGLATSDETFSKVKLLSEKLGKTPVEVNDYPGFVVNRLLIPMINEACYTLMEGVADAESIDTVMKLGAAHPMGPLALGDLIGLDVCLSIMEVLYDGFKDTKYRPCPLLVKMVNAGYLGRKTGKGFFSY
ncbi:MAG: 3-hydroxybutyryl-CoA dehydrogenase [Candidatus Muiribacteriota bacterium]